MAETRSAAPTFIDLFAGCGGASLGFLEAGFHCLLAVDYDSAAVNCYNANLKGSRDAGAVRQDLGSLGSHEAVQAFLKEHSIEPGACDVLVGGPPCQSFSVVGRNKIRALMESDQELRETWEGKNRERTMLFESYARFLEVLAPRWFFFENVPAIISHETYARIQERFNSLKRPDNSELRYRFFPQTYLASDYGVPQRRRRFIMVGYRVDLEVPEWKGPDLLPTPSVAQALDDLPPVSSGHRNNRIPYDSAPESEYQILMRSGLSPQDAAYVTNHACRENNADDVALFGRMAQGARFSDEEVQRAIREINPQHKLIKYSTDKFQDKLHRLNGKDPAWTVTAHLQKDCYKFIHHRQPRTITVREAARLQSFPDRFSFPEALGPAFRLIGNAVPPLLARAFAQSFLASDSVLGRRIDPARRFMPDSLWKRLEPLLVEASHPVGSIGRPPMPLRTVVAAGLKIELEGISLDEVVRVFNGVKLDTYKKHLREVTALEAWPKVVAIAREHTCVPVQQILPLSGS